MLHIILQADLEESPILRGRPISLSRIDGHAKWVSPRVLEIMQESGKLPPPSQDSEIEKDGGKILRFDDGKPTGKFTFDHQYKFALSTSPSIGITIQSIVCN
jgi:predicted amidohydrolase YtcJ